MRFGPGLGENDVIPSIDFPNSDIRSVLDFYEVLTGKKVLYDSTVTGNIRVRVTKPVTRSEAARILETVFALNNFTLIPGPGEIVKVINQGKNVRQFSIPIFSEVDQLPLNGQVVSFLFKLQYADATEVKAALDQVVAATPAITNIVALPKSQAVLVTENSDIIRNLAQIVAKLDGKPADVVSEFFVLQRADAKEVVEKLSKMFEKTPNTAGSIPGGGAPNGNQPPAANHSGVITLSEDSLITGKIKIEADTRTNRIHVVTRPSNLPFLRTLITELDSAQPLGEPYTRPLRFVLAGDILGIIAGAVAEPGVKVESIKGGGSSGATPVGNTAGNLSGGYDSARGTNSSRGSRSGMSSSSGSGSSGRAAGQGDTAPEGVIIRNTKIIADNRINAIIVVGNKEMKTKVFALLDQIDVRAPQVMLTAVIGELTLDDNEEFGIDYLFHHGSLASSGSSTLGLPVAVAGLARNSGASLKNILSATSLTGNGVNALIGATNSLDIIVNALESTGRFRVSSRPMIFTSNNKQAVISSGESVPVPGQINSSYANGVANNNSLVTTANVDYIDVDLKLTVLPLINSDGEVTLQITQEANNIAGSTTISGNAIPNVTKRSIETTVSVANEATVVLGGLVTERKDISNSGIPYLHRLPLVGPLFGSKKKNNTRSELIVLIRPTVSCGPLDDAKNSERIQQKLHFPPDLDASLDPQSTRIHKEAPAKVFTAPKVLLRGEE